MTQLYEFDSEHKRKIRERWITLSKNVAERNNTEDCFSFLTLSSHEIQDVLLYHSKGLIPLVPNNNEGYHYSGKGKLICVERNANKYTKLNLKLSRCNCINTDVCHAIKEEKYFPLDTINLDFDGPISKLNINIENFFRKIFDNQSKHKKDFSLYLTFPELEESDPDDFKAFIKQIIKNNLDDPNNKQFRKKYTSKSTSYESMLIIGITKVIIKLSSSSNYRINECEYYTYGNIRNGHQRMISLLYDFQFIGIGTSHTALYYEDVLKSLTDKIELN